MFKYTDKIAHANILAMLKMYQVYYPKLNRKECIALMIKKEPEFLGLNVRQKPNKRRKQK